MVQPVRLVPSVVLDEDLLRIRDLSVDGAMAALATEVVLMDATSRSSSGRRSKSVPR
jgi:hypothetical protein